MSRIFKTHLNHLEEVFTLPRNGVLDVGAARGDFLCACARAGIEAHGIEYHQRNVDVARARAEQEGITIDIQQGNAEYMPYPDNSFSFVNVSEVIEHVKNPNLLVKELFRVLKPDGFVYISVPSRFSWYDTHFHTPLVNWLPRSWSDIFLLLVGKQKNYENSTEGDFQRLSEMHYYTFSTASSLFKAHGFVVEDLRLKKIHARIKNSFLRPIAQCLYCVFLRPWYVRAFHFILRKPL